MIATDTMRLTTNEAEFLRMASGGIATRDGTPADKIALSLEEKGLLKVVTLSGRGTEWKLSSAGCEIVYADD